VSNVFIFAKRNISYEKEKKKDLTQEEIVENSPSISQSLTFGYNRLKTHKTITLTLHKLKWFNYPN